jgi:metal-sulfur cluster biosynthetic enzyme
MITKKDVEKILKNIPDPEIGVSLWDLGLIYDIDVDTSGTVEILMTLTSMGCPLFELMADPIRQKVGKLKGVKNVNIALTFDPPWTADRISKAAKKQLGC